MVWRKSIKMKWRYLMRHDTELVSDDCSFSDKCCIPNKNWRGEYTQWHSTSSRFRDVSRCCVPLVWNRTNCGAEILIVSLSKLDWFLQIAVVACHLIIAFRYLIECFGVGYYGNAILNDMEWDISLKSSLSFGSNENIEYFVDVSNTIININV